MIEQAIMFSAQWKSHAFGRFFRLLPTTVRSTTFFIFQSLFSLHFCCCCVFTSTFLMKMSNIYKNTGNYTRESAQVRVHNCISYHIGRRMNSHTAMVAATTKDQNNTVYMYLTWPVQTGYVFVKGNVCNFIHLHEYSLYDIFMIITGNIGRC